MHMVLALWQVRVRRSAENEFAERPSIDGWNHFSATPEDAADHLAGEDEEMVKWVSGGRSTLATVEAFFQNNQESGRSGGPRRAFGVFDCASNRLVGFIEVNLERLVNPGEVNVSYGIFPQWR